MDLERINFSELRDSEIVARMRNCNYEKLKSLARMHLSFELDLNTDELDLPSHEIVYEDKGKMKTWNRLSKKHKHGAVVAALTSGSTGCASGSSAKGYSSGLHVNDQCGGSPPESLHQTIDQGFLFHLQELKEFLISTKNIQEEGIFRKTGSVSRQNDLRLQIQNDKPLDLEAGGYTVHDCATIFKRYLAELPEPLLTDAHYPAHLQIAPLCIAVNAQMDNMSNVGKHFSISSTSSTSVTGERFKRELHVLNSIQLLLLLLPEENRQLLQHIIEILHNVALQQNHNKMGPDNLAILFAPHLICPRNLPPEALHYLARKLSSILSYMIVRGQDIFGVPAKLATDLRAHFQERKRRKTMSPEMTLDESISDVSTVNTVYTFVDREKTAAAKTTNNTDTELAQLYAHIQSMPESSRKRRLIKQFNKQNGQGTPLQLQAMNRLRGTDSTRSAKSLSDSIKKHIFHKGIMSRTPKRQPVPSIVLETPNNSSTIYHKQRALFQSPNPQTMPSSSTDSKNLYSSSTSSSSLIPPVTAKTETLNNGNLTPYSLKSHPLQKSISSSSLLMSHQSQHKYNSHIVNNTNQETLSSYPSKTLTCIVSTNSNDGYVCKTKSVSAPVSRQTSSDLQQHINNNTSITSNTSTLFTGDRGHNYLEESCLTPLKLISETAKHLAVGDVEKKTVAWDDSPLIDRDYLGNTATPLQKMTPANDLKSRYKSEPNLSMSHCETPGAANTSPHDMITPITKSMPRKSLTHKLMKGVSMGNLRFPFSTPDSTKRLVRTVSSSLKRRGSDDLHIYHQAEGLSSSSVPLLLDVDDDELDDETFEDDPADDCGSESVESNTGGSSSSELPGCSVSYRQLLMQQSGLYRNLELVTSTPSLLLGRRSMSPITKSTQRMPKAMQESIMTPRSRKPVMVLTTTVSSTDQNQTVNHTDLSDRDEDNDEVAEDGDLDEDAAGEFESDSINGVLTKAKPLKLKSNPPQPEIINEDATSLGGYSDIFKRREFSSSNTNSNRTMTNDADCGHLEKKATDELSSHFKEYLLTRSVLTAAPVDSSFSSHSDDYESSGEMDDIDVNQLSSSLLYCLDGNQPENEDHAEVHDATINETNEGDSKENLSIDESIPNDTMKNMQTITENMTTTAECSTHLMSNRLATNPFVILNNARKRAATSELEKMSSLLFSNQSSPHYNKGCFSSPCIAAASTSKKLTRKANVVKQKSLFPSSSGERRENNKENSRNYGENYVTSKKLLIRKRQEHADEECPDETSF